MGFKTNIKALKDAYLKAKESSVGSTINCPSCGMAFVKSHYQSVFCSTHGKTKCKDHYWNNVTETKRNNTTRISPANAAWKLLNDTPVVLGHGDSQREIDRQDRLEEELNAGDDGLDVTVERCEWCECLKCRCDD